MNIMDGQYRMNTAELQKYEEDRISIGRTVDSLLHHNGWKVFMALYYRKLDAIRLNDDYQTLEDFKADRRACKMVEEMVAELESFVEEAESAYQTLQEISQEANSQTPSILSVDHEADDAVEG